MDAEDQSDDLATEARDQVAGRCVKLKSSDFPGLRSDAALELPNLKNRQEHQSLPIRPQLILITYIPSHILL